MVASTILIAALVVGSAQAESAEAPTTAAESAYRSALAAVQSEDYGKALFDAQQALGTLTGSNKEPASQLLSLQEVEAIETILEFEARTGRSELPVQYIARALDSLQSVYRASHPRVVRLKKYLDSRQD